MEEELKKVDTEIQEVLKKYNCTLQVNHIISINKLKPVEPEVVVPEKVIEDLVA